MSAEHLRMKLAKAGYDEDELASFDRATLLTTFAGYLLKPPASPKAEGGKVGMSEEELTLSVRGWGVGCSRRSKKWGDVLLSSGV